MGSLDLRSSCALILSIISAGTDSVLIRCRPEGQICVHKTTLIYAVNCPLVTYMGKGSDVILVLHHKVHKYLYIDEIQSLNYILSHVIYILLPL